MNLKQHNDIVSKLLEQIDLKDKEILKLNKQITNQSKNINGIQTKNQKANSPAQLEKQIQKRIAQLNKEHNAKISQLNQEIKTITNQNNELKERLALKGNLDQKEKDHIAEVIKKNVDRKPGSQNDIKITSLVSHYEAQINKKNSIIQTLKRQIKSLSLTQTKNLPLKASEEKNNQVQDDQYQNEDFLKKQTSNRFVPILEHKQSIKKLETQIKKYADQLKKQKTELTDLKAKYNQLTKEYYRILNESGLSTSLTKDNQNKLKPSTKSTQTFQKNYKSTEQPSQVLPQDRLDQFSFCLSQQSEQIESGSNISTNFEKNFKKFNHKPQIIVEQDFQFSQTKLQNLQTKNNSERALSKKTQPKNLELIEQIMSILQIKNQCQIIPFLINLMAKLSFNQLNESIINFLQELLYNFGMGRVAKSQMLDVLLNFQVKCNGWIQSNELLSEICIEVGAKKEKLLQKISSYKQLQKEFMQKMKSVSFLTQLAKSQKVLQFINFFELDKSDFQLPEQLKSIYQQLKYVKKFIKEVNATMNVQLKNQSTLEQTLERILRKIQRYHSWQVELQKENQRKIQTKFKKNQE